MLWKQAILYYLFGEKPQEQLGLVPVSNWDTLDGPLLAELYSRPWFGRFLKAFSSREAHLNWVASWDGFSIVHDH